MITFRKVDKIIVGTVDGKPFNITNTEDNATALQTMSDAGATIKEVLAFVKASRSQEIAGANKYLMFKPVTNEYFLTFDGYRSKHAIPATLVKFIEESHSKDTDFMPIVKAWARLLGNPRYNNKMGELFAQNLEATSTDQEEVARLMSEEGFTVEAATALATYQDKALTVEGLLALYKVAEIVTWEYIMEEQEDGTFLKVKNPKYKRIPATVDPTSGDVITEEKWEKPEFKEDFIFTPAINKDGDKFFSADVLGYVYRIGQIQKLPENALRNLNNTFGGGGLYVGGLEYIKKYKGHGTHVLTCFADPGDILSFQDRGAAIRMDALMPNNVWDEDVKLKSVYHSSDYGKVSQERIEAIIADAVHRDVDLRTEQQDISDTHFQGQDMFVPENE